MCAIKCYCFQWSKLEMPSWYQLVLTELLALYVRHVSKCTMEVKFDMVTVTLSWNSWHIFFSPVCNFM